MIALLIITVINPTSLPYSIYYWHVLKNHSKYSKSLWQKRGWRFKNKYNIEHQDKPVATVHVHKYLPLSSRDTL